MNQATIREQIEILRLHMERESFDPDFAEVHARYLAELARLQRQTAFSVDRPTSL